MKDSYFELKPDQTLGRNYHIVEHLGRGYEGEVYKIVERRTGIVRAAKLFYPRKKSNGKKILWYANKLHKLSSCPVVINYLHRDMVRVHKDSIEILVSDFIDGVKLSDYIKSQPGKKNNSFEALHLFYALVQGVEAIHYLGEYHGDIHSDNILIKRRGLSFDVHLVDFYDWGKPSRVKIQTDVYDLITVLHEMIGGQKWYSKAGQDIKQIVMGRKQSLIRKKMKNAGHIRLLLENLDWE